MAFINSTNAALGANGGTTGSVNMSGATAFFVAVPYYTALSGTPSVSDSVNGSTYTGLTLYNNGTIGIKVFYKLNASSSSSMTFTVSGTSIYCSILVQGFSGSSWAFESGTDQGNQSTGTSTLQPSASASFSTGSLLVTAGVVGSSVTLSVSDSQSYTLTDQVTYSGGANEGGAIAYSLPAGSGSTQPTWAGFAGGGAGCAVAAFSFSTGGGNTLTPPAGTLTITKYAPSLKNILAPAVRALTLSPKTPILKAVLTPGVKTLSISTFAPVRALGLVPAVRSLTVTRYAPSLINKIIPARDALILTGYPPNLGANHIIVVPVANLHLTGYAPNLTNKLVIPVRSLAITGRTASLTQILAPSRDALVLAGFAPVLQAGAGAVYLVVSDRPMGGLKPQEGLISTGGERLGEQPNSGVGASDQSQPNGRITIQERRN